MDETLKKILKYLEIQKGFYGNLSESMKELSPNLCESYGEDKKMIENIIWALQNFDYICERYNLNEEN